MLDTAGSLHWKLWNTHIWMYNVAVLYNLLHSVIIHHHFCYNHNQLHHTTGKCWSSMKQSDIHNFSTVACKACSSISWQVLVLWRTGCVWWYLWYRQVLCVQSRLCSPLFQHTLYNSIVSLVHLVLNQSILSRSLCPL